METIKKLLSDGKTDEAIGLLEEYVRNNQSSEEAYILLGNAYRKREDFKNALNCYLSAMEINPESPASIAYKQIISILDFYNKDIYNP